MNTYADIIVYFSQLMYILNEEDLFLRKSFNLELILWGIKSKLYVSFKNG